MAMEAIQTSKRKLSCRKAAGIYNVPEPILRARIAGRPSHSDYRPKAQNLTKLEENIIVQYIFDRDYRGFSPRLANVEDIVNNLLETRRAKRVGKC
jgi:helix-turn-helix, Psq domain